MNTTTIRHRLLAVGLVVCTLVGATAAGTTAGASADVPDVLRPELDDANVDQAIVGISLFVIDNSASLDSGITAPCPLMTTDQYGYFMGQQGLTANLAGWFVDLVYYTDIGSGAPGVTCGIDIDAHLDQIGTGPPHGGNIEAIVLPDDSTFNDVLALIERATLFGPGPADIGGELGGVCYSGDRSICIVMWHRAGMVITGILAGPSAEVTQDRAVALLTSMVPTTVQSLIDYADLPAPGASTTVASPTVPAATVAPATVPAATATSATVAPPTVPPTTAAPVTPTTVALPTIPPPTVPPATVAPTTASPVTVPVASVPVSTIPPLVQPTAPPGPTSAPTTPPGPVDVSAARTTLADFIANNPIGTDVGAGAGITPPCPGSGDVSMSLAMTEVGLLPNMADYRVKVVESGIAPGLGVVACGGDVITALVAADPAVPSHTPLLSMYDITGSATFDQVLAERPGVTLLQSNIPTIGGEIYGGDCGLPPADISVGTFCVRIWHREGLVIMIEVGGTGQADMDAAVTDVLLTLVPEVVNDLATNASWPVPSATG